MKLTSFFGIVSVALYAISVGYSASPTDCCASLDTPPECHFLCGKDTISWLSIVTWRCVHQHGAAVATCKINKGIDYVTLFGERFSQTIQDGFNTVADTVKEKITDFTKFASATAKELETVPQDILSALDTLKEMTVTQFNNLIARLQSFTTQNLRYLLNNVPIVVVEQNYPALAEKSWDKEQMAAITSTAFTNFGRDIELWTASQIRSLSKLVAGVPSSKLARVGTKVLNKTINIFCQAKMSIHQKAVLLIPAESLFGKIIYWDLPTIRRMCNLFEALTPEELLQLGADNVVSALKDLEQLSLDGAQRHALVLKFKESLGKAASWSIDNIKQLGSFVRDLDPSDLHDIAADKIEKVLDDINELEFSPKQAIVLVNKAKEFLGEPGTWLAQDLKRVKRIISGLTPSELEHIDPKEIWASIQELQTVKWTTDQAIVVFEKVKNTIDLPQVKREDLIALGNLIDAIESTDAVKMANVVLLFTFPKAFLIKTASVALLRQFISIYTSNTKDDIVTLGSIATTLTRAELNETQLADILGVLGKVINVEWEEDQIAELFIKVRDELGDISALEMSQVDNPNWGFNSLKQMGKVVTGVPTEELEKFPIRGIEDSVEVMGQQEGWKRGQIIALVKRLREYWRMQNMTLDKLQEVDIATMGAFIQGFTRNELESLPESLMLTAIRQLGEVTGMPEDKMKSRAYSAFNFLHKQTGYNFLNGSDIRSLGNLVVGLGKDAYNKITKDAFLTNLYDIVRKPGMPMDKLKEIAEVAKGHFEQTDAGQWLGEQWRQLGPAVKAMDVEDISRISKEAFEDVVDELGSMDGWTVEQAKVMIAKAKEFWSEEDVGKWSGTQLRKLGAFVQGLNAREIAKIATSSYNDMMGRCAHIRGMEAATLQALARRGKEVYVTGDVSALTTKHLKQLGCAVTGLLPTDLSNLNVNNIDMIAELGKHADWTFQQLKILAEHVKSATKDLRDDYLISVANIVRGYTPDDIESIAVKAFKQGAGVIGKISELTQEQLYSLAKKAKETWGVDVSRWSRAQISEAGTILAGLDKDDISRLAHNVIEMIPIRSLKKMTKEQIAGFTPDQLKKMDSAQVNAISSLQRSYLSEPQAAALRGVESSDPQEDDPWECEGGVCSSASCLSWSLALFFFASLFASLKVLI